MKCVAVLFLASLLELSTQRTLAFGTGPVRLTHQHPVAPLTTNEVPSTTTILRVSQVPLDSQSHGDATTRNAAATVVTEEDEREFLLMTNRELLRQAEEEHRMRYEQHRRLQHPTSNAPSLGDHLLKNSHYSFKNVESMSENLFNNQPLVALAIFTVVGAFVAYMSGLVFLDGYISSLNPALNGGVPYWNENVPTDEESILLINTLHDIKDKLPSLWFWD